MYSLQKTKPTPEDERYSELSNIEILLPTLSPAILAFLSMLAFEQIKNEHATTSGNLESNVLQQIIDTAVSQYTIEQQVLKTVALQHNIEITELLNQALDAHLLHEKKQGQMLRKHFFFPHTNLQKYFAANAIAALWQSPHPYQVDETRTWIATHKYLQSYEDVFGIAARILSKTSDDLHSFFVFLLSEPRELSGFREALLMITCLGNCDLNIAFHGRDALIENIAHWLLLCDARELQLSISQSLVRYLSVLNTALIQNRLIEMLNSNNALQRQKACLIVSRCIRALTNAARLSIFPLVLACLEDKEPSLRATTCQIIPEMSEDFSDNFELIMRFLSCLQDKEPSVRAAACQIIPEMSRFFSDNFELIMRFLSCLQDKEPSVRAAACQIMPAMSVFFTDQEELFMHFMNCLGDNDPIVRVAAWEISIPFFNSMQSANIIPFYNEALLPRFLVEEELYVRITAHHTLTTIAEKNPQMLSILSEPNTISIPFSEWKNTYTKHDPLFNRLIAGIYKNSLQAPPTKWNITQPNLFQRLVSYFITPKPIFPKLGLTNEGEAIIAFLTRHFTLNLQQLVFTISNDTRYFFIHDTFSGEIDTYHIETEEQRFFLNIWLTEITSLKIQMNFPTFILPSPIAASPVESSTQSHYPSPIGITPHQLVRDTSSLTLPRVEATSHSESESSLQTLTSPLLKKT
jgi:hypothetical protein